MSLPTEDLTEKLSLLLSGQLTLKYGTTDLEQGIKAALADASAQVKAGFRKEHTASNVGLRVYASEAGGCARQIAFRMLGLKQEEPSDELRAIFLVGDILHEALQTALLQEWPDFTPEIPWVQDGVSGRADGLYYLNGQKTILEIKTVSRSGMSFATWKGPKPKNVYQGALSANVLGAAQVHIVYIGKETIHKRNGTNVSMFSWVLPLDEEQTVEEHNRLSRIPELVAGGTLPEREWAFGYIDDPDLFPHDPCGFCPFKALCQTLGSGEQPLTKLQQLLPNQQWPDLTITEDK